MSVEKKAIIFAPGSANHYYFFSIYLVVTWLFGGNLDTITGRKKVHLFVFRPNIHQRKIRSRQFLSLFSMFLLTTMGTKLLQRLRSLSSVRFNYKPCYKPCDLSLSALIALLEIRVSNGMGQYNFSGQRDRSFFIVPGQRDSRRSSKSCQGTGRARTAKIWDGTGRDSQNPGRDAGQNGTEQKRMF